MSDRRVGFIVHRPTHAWSRLYLYGLALGCLGCRPTAPGPTAPDNRPEVEPKATVREAQTPVPAPRQDAAATQSEPPSIAAQNAPTTSLRLSTLPADTMAIARVRGESKMFQDALNLALETEPASLRRSLPLALRLPLSMLAMTSGKPHPFSQRPMALVWDPQQRAFWIWNQPDLSLAARNSIEQALGATTTFSPPYWIHKRPGDPLEYFVHTRARWFIACPKAFAPALREWLKDTKADRPGRLDWAPSSLETSPLLVRWRYPQLLESAPAASLGVIGELQFSGPTGLLINGAPRSSP